ncbi:MAG: lipoyl synthase [Thermodesulfobacteriota bacterium]|nr:lipoyl synthase [Thermodesulfobacteriota bacterium]
MKLNHIRKPDWLKVKFPAGANYTRIDRYHRLHGLNSVCRSAACPNQGECWSQGTATFMILGTACSRNCRFCNVTNGQLERPDPQEPGKVATAIYELELKHAVITTVTRDDLADGGASQFVALIREIRKRTSECRIELLISDLQGNREALTNIVAEKPDIIGHNVETVPRLYSQVRPEAEYQRTLSLLADVHHQDTEIITKSGLMLGMGETENEVLQVMTDLREHDCQLLTLGQYLAPTRDHFSVQRYVSPQEFSDYAEKGLALGFAHVEAGPLVRSSYHAEEQYDASIRCNHG